MKVPLANPFSDTYTRSHFSWGLTWPCPANSQHHWLLVKENGWLIEYVNHGALNSKVITLCQSIQSLGAEELRQWTSKLLHHLYSVIAASEAMLFLPNYAKSGNEGVLSRLSECAENTLWLVSVLLNVTQVNPFEILLDAQQEPKLLQLGFRSLAKCLITATVNSTLYSPHSPSPPRSECKPWFDASSNSRWYILINSAKGWMSSMYDTETTWVNAITT